MKRLLPLVVAGLLVATPSALGDHTPAPESVTIAGSLQSELGCGGDWDPECAATGLAYDAAGDAWTGTFAVPAGTWDYKAALGGSWDENYGLGAAAGGANIGLTLATGRDVTFYYDHETHWITDDVNSVIATVPGSFQSELGCPGDWQPECLRSWLQDADGDGVYTFTTDDIPAGSYEAKAAIGRSWTENYGAGGVRDGANVPFTVGAAATVSFAYDAGSHVLTITSVSGAPAQDGDVWWDGLGHDSRDALYRVPGGAVEAGGTVLLRFRSFHGDLTGVTLRTWHTGLGAERLHAMERVARDVSCDADLAFRCDFWQAEVEAGPLGTLYYRFVAGDGTAAAYYEDDSDVRDGGWGRPFASPSDRGWAVTVHDPAFEPLAWMRDGVVYQIFPDRFRNGNPANDPARGQPNRVLRSDDPRYGYPNGETPALDQILRLPWGASPEGACRSWDAACEPRFGWDQGGREGPRGRDYFGGDLDGVVQQLPYLKELGVTVLYFNPIFDAASNHRYDTRDYLRIDPYLGDTRTWRKLEREASGLGMRIVLDGVFNHMSSDSPIFDRYGNWPGSGACEAVGSATRHFFRFRPPAASEPAPCAPYTRDGESYYHSWFGFDSLPQLSEHADVRELVFGADDSVARAWLRDGADGWRLDVMQDKSTAFWQGFRTRVKQVDPDGIIVGELWKKFDVLPFVHGDTADSTMNYRFRDAVLGLLAPQPYDSKGFPGGGVPLAPSTVVERLESVREDYPEAAYLTQMTLLDSHDTERALWTLTPGAPSPAAREADPANVAEGKQRLRLAALLQMTSPGAPTIYYGDEVGLTGADDPDNRRTYPWGDDTAERGGDTRRPDTELLGWYRGLTALRSAEPALTRGDLRFLLADDAAGTLAYGRKLGDRALVVAVNASEEARTVRVPVAGYLPDGTATVALVGGASPTVAGGELVLELDPLAGAVVATKDADLTGPGAPAGLTAHADGLSVSLAWDAVDGAAGYDVYRSPVTRGGYVKVNPAPVAATSFVDGAAGLVSGQRYHYVVRALDEHGNPSGDSNEASAVPAYPIGWANVQWPPTLVHTVSAVATTETVYGQVWIDGVTSAPGATPGLRAELGYGAPGSHPAGWTTWVPMAFNVDTGDNDEFRAALQPTVPGTYDYVARYSTSDGAAWTYADLGGPFTGLPGNPGVLTVHPPADTTAPAAPTGLQALNAGPTAIALAWEAVADADIHRYDVLRSTTSGGPYAKVAAVPAGTTAHTDENLATGTRYHYVVVAVDESANASPASNEASAVPERREVAVTFAVAVPSSTPAEATVHVAGNVPELCSWCNPHTVALARGADGVWRTTLTLLEGTSLEFKYTLGSWDTVEKGASCEEVGNRQARVAGDAAGTQVVEGTVLNWRAVGACPA